METDVFREYMKIGAENPYSFKSGDSVCVVQNCSPGGKFIIFGVGKYTQTKDITIAPWDNRAKKNLEEHLKTIHVCIIDGIEVTSEDGIFFPYSVMEGLLRRATSVRIIQKTLVEQGT